jgi:MFS family permease
LIALCVTMFIAGIEMGPIGAFLPELFRSRYRYTATGLSYSVAGVIGGAVPPLMAVPIITTYGGLAFGVIMAGLCLITLLYTLAVPETRNRDLEQV